MLFVVGANDAVGAQQRLVINAQPDHGEVTIAESQRGIACGGECKQFVGPVVDRQHGFFVESAHWNLKREMDVEKGGGDAAYRDTGDTATQ